MLKRVQNMLGYSVSVLGANIKMNPASKHLKTLKHACLCVCVTQKPPISVTSSCLTACSFEVESNILPDALGN